MSHSGEHSTSQVEDSASTSTEETVAILFKGCTSISHFRRYEPLQRRIAHPFAVITPGDHLTTDLPRLKEKVSQDDAKYATLEACREARTPQLVVFYAERTTVPGTRERFALKVAFDIQDSEWRQSVMVKYCDEAIFHQKYLFSVQGLAVPRHYGVWYGRAEWGAVIGVSIMQWGGSPCIERIRKSPGPPGGELSEIQIAVLEAFHALHTKAHVEHANNNFASHHILYDEESKRAFILDFGRANVKHKCGLQFDLFRKYASVPPPEVFGCEELCMVCKNIRTMKYGSYLNDPEMKALVDEFDRKERERELAWHSTPARKQHKKLGDEMRD